MTPEEYRAAIATLGLSQLAAGRWLGVSPKTAQNYASKGPSGPAAVAVKMALAYRGLDRYGVDPQGSFTSGLGRYVRHSDLTAAIGLP